MSFGTYDAATGVYQAQTSEQFFNSLTGDIQRALDAGVLDELAAGGGGDAESEGSCESCRKELDWMSRAMPPKSLREIQAEEAAAAAVATQKAVVDTKRSERVAAEKAAAEAAWESDRAARDASGKKPCFVCEEFAQEIHYHAPKRYICPLADRLFYAFDRWNQPHTAYLRRDEWLAFKENKERQRSEAARAAAEASRASELGGLIDAALNSAPPQQAAKAGKKGKKQTVERFQLDDI